LLLVLSVIQDQPRGGYEHMIPCVSFFFRNVFVIFFYVFEIFL